MRAALFRGPHLPLELAEVPIPDLGPGEALVKVAACGVCHTDLHYVDHGTPTFKTPPLILGHEVSGVVADWKGNGGLAVGSRVLVPAVLACGSCPACRSGRENICESMRMLGNHIDGGYAEYVAVSAKDLIPLPESLPLEASAIIADALTTPYHAVVNRGKVRPGDRVAVFGCGGIGLNVVQIAAAFGARVVAVDLRDEKLEWARSLGATATVNAGSGKVDKAVRELTGGGAEVVFECVGLPASQEAAFGATRNGGRLVLVGYSPDQMRLNSGRVMFREMEIKGSLGCRSIDYPRVVEMVRQGRLKLQELVTATFSLERINAALDALRAGQGVRSIVTP
jgi:6-hydroxycyclohex-1-ene-1-carbonyl-CoA dehydrogenase